MTVQDVADGDVTMCLTTVALDSPSIVAFVDNGSLNALFVVGDTVHTELTGKSRTIKGALLVLLSLYYIFDLDYPKPYSMLMALMQVFVTDEPYRGETSKSFKVFVKKLRQAFEQMPVEDSSATPLP